MTNKHKVVLDYLSNYPDIKSFLYFNTSLEELNHTSVNTITSDYFEQKYLRGGIKNYDFAVTFIGQYDTGTSDININQIFDLEKFMLWIDEQNKNKNFPEFEDGEVISIENLQNQPSFSGINETGNLAKYMFQIRIKYLI
jgi:hypothetical protein|nr:MAG TPA: Minor capsid protein from bacteriophage [Caudoviricetes sp.]